jgi:hypothetical protein
MEWHFAVSGNLYMAGYDLDSHILSIRFKSGSEYEYYDVSRAVFVSLLRASSKGRFFHRYIKKRYKYKKIYP